MKKTLLLLKSCFILILCIACICSCTFSPPNENRPSTETISSMVSSDPSADTESVSAVIDIEEEPVRYRIGYEKTALHEVYPNLKLNGPMYFKDGMLHVVDQTGGLLHVFDAQGILQTMLSVPKQEKRFLLFAYPMSEERFVVSEKWRDTEGYLMFAVSIVTAVGETVSTYEFRHDSDIGLIYSVYEEYGTVLLMLGMDTELYYFSCSDTRVTTYQMQESVFPYAQYVYSGSGKFTRLFSNEHKMTYDFYKNESKETPLRMPEKYQYETLYRGDDKNYYIRSNGNLYLMKDDGQFTCILNGMDCGMPNKNNDVQKLAILDDHTVFSQELTELYLYCMSPVEETEERQEIELIVMDLGNTREWLEATVLQFNNQNTDYYVSLEYKNYIDGTETNLEKLLDAALQDLLLYHKHPDILILDNTNLLAKYQDKGIFSDLNQLLNTSILGCVKEAFGTGEYLYQVPMMMRVDTFAASTDITDGFLTYERFYEIADSLAPGEILCGDAFNHTFFKNALMDFVDFDAKTTSYHTETFHDVVLYRDRLSDMTDFYAGSLYNGAMYGAYGTYGDMDTYWTPNGTLPTALENGSVKFLAVNFNTVEAYSAAKLLYGDTPFTLCGYPSLDGCGASIDAYLPTAVFADSDVLQGCKEFMEFLLSDARQTDDLLTDSFLPVTRSGLEKEIDCCRTYHYPTDIVEKLRDGNTPGYLNLNAYRDEIPENTAVITIDDHDRADMINFFEHCHMRANADPFILSIVNEELSFYEGHARTLEETTKIIDSRVWIYLNE